MGEIILLLCILTAPLVYSSDEIEGALGPVMEQVDLGIIPEVVRSTVEIAVKNPINGEEYIWAIHVHALGKEDVPLSTKDVENILKKCERVNENLDAKELFLWIEAPCCIRDKSVTDALLSGLQTANKITRLKMCNAVIGEVGVKKLIALLIGNSVQVLDISGLVCTSQLRKMVIEWLKSTSLVHLAINNCSLEASEVLTLIENLPAENIVGIYLGENQISDECVRALSKLSNLKELSLCKCRYKWDISFWRSLFFLGSLETLEALDLRACGMGSEAIIPLMFILTTKTLSYLRLEDTGIGSSGIYEVLRAVRQKSTFERNARRAHLLQETIKSLESICDEIRSHRSVATRARHETFLSDGERVWEYCQPVTLKDIDAILLAAIENEEVIGIVFNENISESVRKELKMRVQYMPERVKVTCYNAKKKMICMFPSASEIEVGSILSDVMTKVFIFNDSVSTTGLQKLLAEMPHLGGKIVELYMSKADMEEENRALLDEIMIAARESFCDFIYHFKGKEYRALRPALPSCDRSLGDAKGF